MSAQPCEHPGAAPSDRLDQAMLLCAGLGLRMRPLTASRAKPSLPLMNHPLVLHCLDRLEAGGVLRVAMNLHHAPATLEATLTARPTSRQELLLSREAEILGTGGGVAAALPRLDRTSPLLVMNGDSLSDADPSALFAAHAVAAQSSGARATLAVRPLRPGDRYTPVYVDDDGALCGIGSAGLKGEAHVFIGMHLLDPGLLDGRPVDRSWDLVHDLYMPMLDRGERLGAHRHDGWWVEIGSPRLYLQGHLSLLGEPSFLRGLPPAAGTSIGDGASFAGPGCEGLAAAAVMRSALGAGCSLGEGCRVEGSLLGAGVRVGPRAVIRDSIVWDGSIVMEGAELSGLLVHEAAGLDGRMELA